jgi:hypothetical protein
MRNLHTLEAAADALTFGKTDKALHGPRLRLKLSDYGPIAKFRANFERYRMRACHMCTIASFRHSTNKLNDFTALMNTTFPAQAVAA